MLLATISIVLVASFWAEDFYRMWIGEQYLSGTPFSSVALLLRILLIGTVAGYASNIAGQILLGAGRVRLLATSHICGAGLNLMFSLILIRPYGLAGVAASSVIAAVLVELIAILLVLQRALGLRVKDFLKSACMRPVAVGVLLATLIMCIRRTGQPGDWLHLILHGVLAGTSAAAVVLVVGITAEERQRFLVQPMRRLLRGEMPAVKSTT
jgi:O-antigen/teichoic acid export membrane protein